MFLVSSYNCLYPIQWSLVLSREWRCSWSSTDRRCSNYIWVIDNFIAFSGASYIRDLTVYNINKIPLLTCKRIMMLYLRVSLTTRLDVWPLQHTHGQSNSFRKVYTSTEAFKWRSLCGPKQPMKLCHKMGLVLWFCLHRTTWPLLCWQGDIPHNNNVVFA